MSSFLGSVFWRVRHSWCKYFWYDHYEACPLWLLVSIVPVLSPRIDARFTKQFPGIFTQHPSSSSLPSLVKSFYHELNFFLSFLCLFFFLLVDMLKRNQCCKEQTQSIG